MFLKEINILYCGLPGTAIALKNIMFITSDWKMRDEYDKGIVFILLLYFRIGLGVGFFFLLLTEVVA